MTDEERARNWNVEPLAWDVAVLIAQRLDLSESTEWSGDEDIAEIADEVAAALAAERERTKEQCIITCGLVHDDLSKSNEYSEAFNDGVGACMAAIRALGD